MDKQSLILHEQHTKFKTIYQIEFGEYKCETWYYSPFPTVSDVPSPLTSSPLGLP